MLKMLIERLITFAIKIIVFEMYTVIPTTATLFIRKIDVKADEANP